MTIKTSAIIAACALASVLGVARGSSHSPGAMPVSGADENGATALRGQMRKLWEDHVTWTRMFIVSDVAGLPDLGPTTARLLQNQVDIGAAIKPYYGDAAGTQLTALLKRHILTAADILAAAKAGDTAGTQAAATRWHANADSIAAFLSTANPHNWPLADMKQMMKDHLDLTLAEAVARLHGDYAADIAAYDRVHEEILRMSDMLSDGIIRQFPDRIRQVPAVSMRN